MQGSGAEAPYESSALDSAGDPRMSQATHAEPSTPVDETGPEDQAIVPADPLEGDQLEALLLNLEASLRVYARAHFFSWTQGLLQSVIRHEVLICAMREGKPLAFRVDSFATAAPNPAIFGEIFLKDARVVPSLVKAWRARRFSPMICETGAGGPLGRGLLARELERAGATQVLLHGMHDADGQVDSLFLFAAPPGTLTPQHLYLAQLLVPSLHSAWVRTQVSGLASGDEGLQAAGATGITSSELEILRWMYLGKSNFEIGAILDISGFTVKNHVQKILRKLNVVNRAQAVGKALESRILNP